MITIFTPTFNRKNELVRLYHSLCNQSSKEFIWYVIDDGSSDGTDDYIKSIIENCPFEIIYNFQENSGKHVAINRALDNCKTDFMICVDSDDYLREDAVAVLNQYVGRKDTNECLANVGPRFSENNGISNWNCSMPNTVLFSDIYNKYKYHGETYMLWNLSFFTNIRFPVFCNERFVPESAIYDILDRNSTVYICNEKIYFSDYQNDGLTRNSKSSFVNNRRGYAYANYISSQNSNRSFLNRCCYYGRYYAISKRLTDSPIKIEARDKEKLIICVGSLLGIVYNIVYSLNGK